MSGGVLGEHDACSGDLRTGAEALRESENDQKDGRQDPDGLISGQEADQRRRQAHEQDGLEEDLLATDLVALAREVEGAERAGQIADTVGRHREDDRQGRAASGEEDLVEDEGRRQRVELEVHELERGAEPAGDGGANEVRGGPDDGRGRCRGIDIGDVGTHVITPL